VQSPTEVPKENLHSVVLVLPLYLLHQSENHCFKQTFHVIYSHVIIGSTFIYFFFLLKMLGIMNANYMAMFDCKYLSILDILNIWQNSWSNSNIALIIGWLSYLFLT
jgi:hypothetical protein